MCVGWYRFWGYKCFRTIFLLWVFSITFQVIVSVFRGFRCKSKFLWIYWWEAHLVGCRIHFSFGSLKIQWALHSPRSKKHALEPYPAMDITDKLTPASFEFDVAPSLNKVWEILRKNESERIVFTSSEHVAVIKFLFNLDNIDKS